MRGKVFDMPAGESFFPSQVMSDVGMSMDFWLITKPAL